MKPSPTSNSAGSSRWLNDQSSDRPDRQDTGSSAEARRSGSYLQSRTSSTLALGSRPSRVDLSALHQNVSRASDSLEPIQPARDGAPQAFETAPDRQLLVDTLRSMADQPKKTIGMDGLPTPSFQAAADRVQATLQQDWHAVVGISDPASRQRAAQALVAASNAALGKPGHTANVQAACSALLAHDSVASQLPSDSHGALLQAAPYLNLCDSAEAIPLSLMASGASFQTLKPYVDQRADLSADRMAAAQLGDRTAVDLVRAHKDSQSSLPAAHVLRLVDAALGMAAKPFFRIDNGTKVDVSKVVARLEGEQGSAPPDLFAAVLGRMKSPGMLDACITQAREADIYVR